MENIPQVGKLIEDGERRRDAVHIAIAPMVADSELKPGQPAGLSRSDDFEHATADGTPIGIVDPFLTVPVQKGQRFWLFLFTGTITSLRHVWTHPEFTNVAQNIRRQLTS